MYMHWLNINFKKVILTDCSFKILIHIIPARAPIGVKNAPILLPIIVAKITPLLLAEKLRIEPNKTLIGILLSKFADKVESEVQRQLALLPREAIATRALDNSRTVVLESVDEQVAFINLYAPEHLIILCREPWEIANRITAAGSVFVGAYSPESAGDYASGTNHTLPTSGYAKAYSGVNLDSYTKKITFQEITQDGLNQLGNTIEIMAENEQLMAHKYAVTIRKQ